MTRRTLASIVAARKQVDGIAGEPCGLARLALILLDRVTQLGLPRAELLRAAGLDERHLRAPDTRIPLSGIARLCGAITTRITDPVVGLRLGSDARAREFGLVGCAMAYSQTLGAALTRLSRYGGIVSDALVVTLDAEHDTLWVRVDVQPALRALRLAVDARLAALLAVCRELVGAPIAPLCVQLPYRRPAEVGEYERFFRCRLDFGVVATAMQLDDKDVQRPVVLSDPTLVGYLDVMADQAMAALATKLTLADRVRRTLWSALSGGVPDASFVASSLGVSVRTLQRQLRAEHTSFAAVLNHLRQEMAQPLLRDGGYSVAEVGFLLGYEDPGAFRRAFRRWHGLSPRAFRRRPR
jgi:AraC-like DNA-binding protein